MKLLLDQGLPRSAVALLRAQGVNAVHVGDIGLSAARDSEILDSARQEERVVITLDADFHALLAASQASGPSVVRLRVQGLDGHRTVDLVMRVLRVCEHALAAGAIATADVHRIRVRNLPLRGTA